VGVNKIRKSYLEAYLADIKRDIEILESIKRTGEMVWPLGADGVPPHK
jgi:uncharacterized protein YnzC (UPF0291/DUF896 family)